MGCKLKLVALGPIVYGPPRPQQDSAQLRAEIASSPPKYFYLRCLQFRWINSSHVLSPSSLSCPVPQAAYLSASVFTLQTVCQSVPPCSSLAHVGPTTRLQDLPSAPAAGVSQSLPPAWLPLPVCYWPTVTVLASPYPSHLDSQDFSDN